MNILETKKKNGKNTCKYIMLHHTAMGNDKNGLQAANLLSNGEKEVSCHYVIGKDGTVWKIGEDTDRLWHAGSGNYNGITDMNSNAIGIEVDSDGYNFTKEQFNTTLKLVKDLMEKYKIQSKNVIRHADYTTRKWDIGDNFFKLGGNNINDFRKLLENNINEGFYEKIFNEKYNGVSSIYSDMNTAKEKLGDVAFFIAIGLERLKK